MLSPGGIPEFYADLVQIAVGEAGIFLGFRAVAPLPVTSPESDEPYSEAPAPIRAIVRLSKENSKIFAIVLKRSLKNYENEFGPITLPTDFTETFPLETTEW